MISILNRMAQPVPEHVTPEQQWAILEAQQKLRRMAWLEKQYQDAWGVYKYLRSHGKTPRVERVFNQLIRAKAIRIVREPGKPPRIVWLKGA